MPHTDEEINAMERTLRETLVRIESNKAIDAPWDVRLEQIEKGFVDLTNFLDSIADKIGECLMEPAGGQVN